MPKKKETKTKEIVLNIAIDEDPLFEEVVKLVIEQKKVSAASLQKKLRVGYDRASKLIELLREKKVAGPANGAHPSKVLLKKVPKIKRSEEKKIEEAENSKGTISFKGLDGKKYRISMQEKLFSESYLDFKGNGTEAAFEHYNCQNFRIAASIAYQNLRKLHIIAYIDLKLGEYGFNDESVSKQHLFTLNQFADLAQKNKAIDMFYKLKGSYAPEKKDVSLGLSLTDLSNEADTEENE